MPLSLIAILQGVDVSKVPVDALPTGMTFPDFRERVYSAVAEAVRPGSVGRLEVPAVAAPYPASSAAREAVRAAAPAAREPTKPVEVAIPDEPAPLVDANNWQAEADSIIEMVGEAGGDLRQLEAVEAETKTRMSRMQAPAPVEYARAWTVMQGALKTARAKSKMPAVKDVGRPRIELFITNVRNFFATPHDRLPADARALSAADNAKRMRVDSSNATIIASAQAHHPDLAAILEAELAKAAEEVLT